MKKALVGIAAAVCFAGCAGAEEKSSEVVGQVEEAQLGELLQQGSVSVTSFVGFGGGFTLFDASFEEKVDECATTEVGNCNVINCPNGREAGVKRDAGKITLTWTGMGPDAGMPVVLTPDPTTHEYPNDFALVGVTPGATLRVRAAGNRHGVPAFRTRIVAPAPISLLAPSLPENPESTPDDSIPLLPDALKLKIDRSKDLVVSWDGGVGGGGIVDVTLTTSPRMKAPVPDGGVSIAPSPATRLVSCDFPPTARHGVIPRSLLAFLEPTGDASGLVGQMQVLAVSRSTAKRRNWKVYSSVTQFKAPGSTNQVLFK